MNLSRLGPRPRLRVALYVVTAFGLALYLWSRPGVEALAVLALFALWIFLGIPACCGFGRR